MTPDGSSLGIKLGGAVQSRISSFSPFMDSAKPCYSSRIISCWKKLASACYFVPSLGTASSQFWHCSDPAVLSKDAAVQLYAEREKDYYINYILDMIHPHPSPMTQWSSNIQLVILACFPILQWCPIVDRLIMTRSETWEELPMMESMDIWAFGSIKERSLGSRGKAYSTPDRS